MRLGPSQQAFEVFHFVITESRQEFHDWFRFVISVNEGSKTSQSYEFVIPKLQSSGGDGLQVAKRVEFPRWEPTGGLIPTAQPWISAAIRRNSQSLAPSHGPVPRSINLGETWPAWSRPVNEARCAEKPDSAT